MYHGLKEEISEHLQKTVVDVYQAGKNYKTISRVWTLSGYCQANNMMNAGNSVPLLPSLGAVDQPSSRACNSPGGVKNHKVMLEELKATLALQILMFMRPVNNNEVHGSIAKRKPLLSHKTRLLLVYSL